MEKNQVRKMDRKKTDLQFILKAFFEFQCHPQKGQRTVSKGYFACLIHKQRRKKRIKRRLKRILRTRILSVQVLVSRWRVSGRVQVSGRMYMYVHIYIRMHMHTHIYSYCIFTFTFLFHLTKQCLSPPTSFILFSILSHFT